MNKLLYTVVLVGCFASAQTGLYNAGNIRIHENAQLGFHTNLINDSAFDQNLGLVGFYGNTTLNVSGIFAPSFYEIEFMTPNATILNTTVNALNHVNFILGNVITPRNESDINLNFFENDFFTGAGNLNKVDGYIGLNRLQNFMFPVGDSEQLRPLTLDSEAINEQALCAYFFENPNSPSFFTINFDTERRERTLGAVSTVEFWRIEGDVPSTIQISWNQRSVINALTDDVSSIVPVGWSKRTNRWESLGNAGVIGELDQGFVISESFIPNNFEIISFGVLAQGVLDAPDDILTLDNYFLSPNDDGINDFWTFPELELSPNNSVRIFDRFGLTVFEQLNYTNEFTGVANTGNFIVNRESGLPEGVYFYLVRLDDLDLNFQGFLYINR